MRFAKTSLYPIAALVVSGAALTQPAWAEHRDEFRFHGDIARFHEHDWDLWRGGRWYHATHGGRFGWWWVAGGMWYFYPAPVYPYPNPYEPPVAVIVPQTPAQPAPPPPPQNWYYCESSKAYDPYTPSCPGGWRAVPAVPNSANGAPAAPPDAPPTPGR
jgi:hypothetical protein